MCVLYTYIYTHIYICFVYIYMLNAISFKDYRRCTENAVHTNPKFFAFIASSSL